MSAITDSASSRAIKVLQITDTHLYADTGGCLLGLNTWDTLKAVTADVSARHIPADLILATGDLVHDSSASGYRRVFEQLGAFGLPVYCLPGNHDESEALKKSLGESGNGLLQFTEQALYGNWQLIFLDSTLPGSEGGHLGTEALRSLEMHLQGVSDRHVLVCLHHQPVAMGSRWLDTMAIDNAEDFFTIIDRSPQVRGILWGHVHQEYDRMRNNVRLLSSPSTCIQFTPGSAEFAVDEIAPGYRWLTLHEDGRIDTGIHRLARIPGNIDMSSKGY